jgi:pyruvate/2-oxoglutarate dehydrogenase complex dihydrolipoamide acyltransferase (E2) component
MAELSHDIERIVRYVLQELQRTGAASNSSSSAVAATADKPPVAASGRQAEISEKSPRAAATLPSANASVAASKDGRLLLTGRVVTLAAIDGRWSGLRQLVVPPRAIVTPAVRDELRRRNVALTFAAPSANATPATPLLLTLLVHTGAGDAASLVAALAAESVVVRQENLDCLIASCERLAGALAAARGLGLLLTRHATAAICLANRHRGVRAVLASEALTTAAAAVAVGANLLVADPVALGPARLKRIVLDYCRSGVRPCPRVFEKELG